MLFSCIPIFLRALREEKCFVVGAEGEDRFSFHFQNAVMKELYFKQVFLSTLTFIKEESRENYMHYQLEG